MKNLKKKSKNMFKTFQSTHTWIHIGLLCVSISIQQWSYHTWPSTVWIFDSFLTLWPLMILSQLFFLLLLKVLWTHICASLITLWLFLKRKICAFRYLFACFVEFIAPNGFHQLLLIISCCKNQEINISDIHEHK